jgi:hypothetical protein
VTTSAHLRVADAFCRLAGYRSRFVESHPSDQAREAYDALLSGRLDLLHTRYPYRAGPPLSTAVMLLRPTCRRDVALTFLSRLQPASKEIVVFDLADVIRQHGAPENWQMTVIEGAPEDILCLPVLARLGTMSASQIQAWAQGNRVRLELGRVARGFKAGWTEHAERGWLDKQVRARSGPVRPEERQRSPPRRARK